MMVPAAAAQRAGPDMQGPNCAPGRLLQRRNGASDPRHAQAKPGHGHAKPAQALPPKARPDPGDCENLLIFQ
jgi:hypothetical protein